jgi:hypothetical protein
LNVGETESPLVVQPRVATLATTVILSKNICVGVYSTPQRSFLFP